MSPSQRELAGAAGLSLGMTNALLRRFVERGWVKLMHLSGRSLKYILTSEGVEEVLRRSISYFSRAVRSASLYREKIDAFVVRVASEGKKVLVLEGPAELDFLFDYSCVRHGIEFVKNPSGRRRADYAGRADAVFVMAKFPAEIRPLQTEACIDMQARVASDGEVPPVGRATLDGVGDADDFVSGAAQTRASFVNLAGVLFDCGTE